MRSLILLCAVALAGNAGAQTVYRCTVGGKVTYSGTPCANGDERRLRPDAGPSQEDAARAHARVQRQLAEQAAKDSSASQPDQDNLEPVGTPRGGGGPSDPPSNQRVMTSSRDGWDYKARSQLEAETIARATGVAPPLTGAAWESAKTAVHTQHGWEYRTGAEQVRVVAERARRANSRPIVGSSPMAGSPGAAGSPPMLVDQFGNQYINQGGTALSTTNGETCIVAGPTLQNCHR